MGLVGYASSDDENDEQKSQSEDIEIQKAKPDTTTNPPTEAGDKPKDENPTLNSQNETEKQDEKPIIGPSMIQSDVPLGPFLPPMDQAEAQEGAEEAQAQDQESAPAYSSSRALIRELTLPSVPNLDIPPSPPGSPPPGANAKMEQFLDLKSKGIHFNTKLEQSTALKNPSLTEKLLAYVDIDERDQYATTLPRDLWDPAALPEWAFRDRLRKTRERIVKEKEKEAEKAVGSRTSVEFVLSSSSMNPSSVGSSWGGSGGISGLGSAEKKERWK